MRADITLADRVSFYNARFPKWPKIFFDKGWITGTWVIGNNYKANTTLYGAYPPTYLARVFSMFPDRSRLLHLFSGSLEPSGSLMGETRVDLRYVSGLVVPDIRADAAHLPFRPVFDLALADPPYSKPDAKIYGTPMPVRAAVMRSLATVIVPGGFVVWLDTTRPMYRKVEWHECGFVGLARSTNHRVRGVWFYQRRV
jgi:hypothetical protein